VNTHWTERLSELLDGELSAADRAACETHLAECRGCREVLAELRLVIDTASRDVERVPAVDLWPGILSRITADASLAAGRHPSEPGSTSETGARVATFETHATARPRSPRRISFTLPQLALAASLLIAVSAGVSYLAMGRAGSQPTLQEDPIQAQAEPLLPPSAGVERANFADAQYDQAVADLEKILVDMRDELDPRTIVVIERNLSAIDQAIREARAALDADPANTFLNSHLVDARRKKLELLRRATMIHSTSGD
jgi:negative regulator of sigma E activity